MELSAHTILEGMVCGKPGCQCRSSARKGHGLTHCPAHDDQTPSLSVSERNGRVLFKCHSGCSQAEVVAALKAEGLWPERGGKRPGLKARADHNGPLPGPNEDSRVGGDSSHLLAAPGAPSVGADVSASALSPARREHGTGTRLQSRLSHSITRYEIREPDGSLAAVHLRFDGSQGKRMAWQTPDGVKGLGGRPATSLPLYGVDKLGDQIGVILVEGEKCRDALAGLGLPAVGTVTGAATIPADAVLAQLAGRTVYLWPDADPPGQSHMERIAERLTALGCDVIKRVCWEGAPVGGDAADFVARGGAQADVVALLSTAAIWPGDDAAPAAGADGAVETDGPRPVVTSLSAVSPETVRWLWPGRIPQGKLTILDGDPGLGKSTVLLDLAARLTTSQPMPDGSRAELAGPAGVIILSAEDGLADTVRPRLDAAGADLTRVATLHLADEDGEQLLDLSRDLAHLAAVIVQQQAALVVVDPLVAYLGSGVDAYRDQDIRRVLAPLARLAETTNAAIIGVRHLTKGGGANAKYRGGGSIGIIGAARSGLLVAADPDDDERRILATIKSNLAAPAPALAYRLEAMGDQRVRVKWEGVTKHTAAQLLAEPREPEEPSAVDEAIDVLKIILADGPVPAKAVKAQANEAGVSEASIRRAKSCLGVTATKVGFHPAVWHWELPKALTGPASEMLSAFDGG